MSSQYPYTGCQAPGTTGESAQQAGQVISPEYPFLAAWSAYQSMIGAVTLPLPLPVFPTGLPIMGDLSAFSLPISYQHFLPQFTPSPPPLSGFQAAPYIFTTPPAAQQYACDICKQFFNTQEDVVRHVRSDHPGVKPFACPHCMRRYTQLVFMETHLRTHTADQLHQCPHCPKSFVQRKSYLNHLQHQHGVGLPEAPKATEVDELSCSVCDKKFTREKSRQIHMLAHSDERLYACDKCPWTFTDKWKLAAHLRTHAGLRPYVCPHCKESFSQRPTLTRHVRTHTGERPYTCEHCPATFLDSKNLTRHSRVHIGKRGPFSCNLCSASFNRKQMLTAHQRVHKGVASGMSMCDTSIRTPKPASTKVPPRETPQ